ncbi:hypothetical protein K450DRAFT_224205 [Umbelopsis ramanniana AG]|uniref:LAG1-DNAbind-domain-containing protein n=1 Tax=Umbelopsis ramanniana AG TaxID=1314678 RepID=A0AAD5HG32_UMBRA|nr:uncharacterized protein K450DRAFT_224205 [Umbelopsis ramanniana AG]KAI8583097.1 hypothetical protein K450DRAFT_224205 [Umbelopsis ramanniana AG]
MQGTMVSPQPTILMTHASPENMLNDIMAESEDFVFDNHHTVTPSALSSDNPFYQQSASSFSDLIMQQDQQQPVSQSLHRGSTSRSSTSSLASNLQQQHIGGANDMGFAATMDFGNGGRKMSRLQQISPPASPTHSSSLSNTSSSPSPPITPMLHQQQQHQQAYQQAFHDGPTFQHPTIPEEDDEDMLLNQADFAGYLQPNGLDDPLKSKNGIVSARLLQSANVALLRPLIRHYLQSPNPAASGERTVVILTSKVAQKSYGTEKRFLCPPPTTHLIGGSWWTQQMSDKDSGPESPPSVTVSAPSMTVCISGESTSHKGNLEWHAPNGSVMDSSSVITTPSDPVVSGKCVSKQLYINDADEKRKRVECLVKIQLANGFNLGTLASKGIKVISKPSKKRQSVKNMELCIHHGTTISLFNRIRSQTVSTKYLGVSTTNGTPVMFAQTSSDWPGADHNQAPPNGAAAGNGTCFVARTSSWDPFVIWVVDTTRTGESNHNEEPSTFPPPPAIALRNPSGNPIPIHYNQPVVLQCLSTGLVSPVMVIRKVDKASTVVGGARVSDGGPGPNGVGFMAGGEYADEALGDPVSQLHKIALQIIQDPSNANCPVDMRSHQHPNMPHATQPITYLACLNDIVGMHKTTEPRQPLASAMAMMSEASSSPIPMPGMAASWTDAQQMFGISFGSPTDASSVTSQENGRAVRKRRVSCDTSGKNVSTAPPGSRVSTLANKGRRRVNSLNDVANFSGSSDDMSPSGRRGSVSSTASGGAGPSQNGAFWSEDVTDAAVWTIVGTDCATYTFWTPQSTSPFSSQHNSEVASPVTPFPSISHFSTSLAPQQQRVMNGDMGSLTIYGENFTRDLTVWFGDVKASRTEYRCREILTCSVPDSQEFHDSVGLSDYHHRQLRTDSSGKTTDSQIGFVDQPRKKVPILLVRGDGVVYRTGKIYVF